MLKHHWKLFWLALAACIFGICPPFSQHVWKLFCCLWLACQCEAPRSVFSAGNCPPETSGPKSCIRVSDFCTWTAEPRPRLRCKSSQEEVPSWQRPSRNPSSFNKGLSDLLMCNFGMSGQTRSRDMWPSAWSLAAVPSLWSP